MPKRNTRVQTKQPWAQQQGESSKVYLQFLNYRNMGMGRNIKQLARNGIKDLNTGEVLYRVAMTTLQGHSAKYNWVHRAEAWDRYMERRRQAAMNESAQKSNVRLMRAVESGIKIGHTVLMATFKRLRKEGMDIPGMTAKELIQFHTTVSRSLKDLQEIAYKIFGQPTEIVKHEGNVGQSLFSEAEEIGTIIQKDSEAMTLWSKLQRRVQYLREQSRKESE